MRKLFALILLTLILSLLYGCSRYPNTVNTPEDAQGKRIGALEGTPSLRLADELGLL